jgi:hypothetical protein
VPSALLPVFGRFFEDAGLFPPAGRPMADALAAHARARSQKPHGDVVGPFLCPLARLVELDACVAAGRPRPPEVGLVAYPGETHWRGAATRSNVVQVEAPLDERLPADALRVRRFMELPARAELIRVVEGLRRSEAQAKVRCGGLTPDEVPSSEHLAEVLVVCAARRLPLKAAGGLQRPFRQGESTSGGPQHGFVNLLAAASAAMAGAEAAHLVEILDQEEDDGVALLGRIDRHARSLVVSVACHSIDEAVDQLTALGVH